MDAGSWLIDNKGFLPVPIIITEPAVGAGLGAAAVFFHEGNREGPKAEPSSAANGPAEEPLLPPSLSVLFGAATENGTWLAGAAHRGVWKQDHIRYLGALARASINLGFYGTGGDEVAGDSGLDFNADGWYLLQEAMFRIPGSDFFLGGSFDYVSMDIRFDDGNDVPGISEDNFDQTETAGYDSRDNVFTPNRGVLAELEAMFHSGSFLGDFTFQKYKASGLFYWDPHPKLVLGWRLDGDFANGDTPFYALPYIDLRGIPALRYQGEDVLLTEVEARWNVHGRWSLVGFTGIGKAENALDDLLDSGVIFATLMELGLVT